MSLPAQFLANAKATHVFFIDSDMSFPAALCRELLAMDKDVIGAAYPKRTLDMKKLEENLIKTAGNFQDALSLTYEFTVRTTRRQDFQDGLLKRPWGGHGRNADCAACLRDDDRGRVCAEAEEQ